MTPNTIRAARAGLDLGQAALAELAGVHRKTLARYEQTPFDPSSDAKALAQIKQTLESHGVVIADNTITFREPPAS